MKKYHKGGIVKGSIPSMIDESLCLPKSILLEPIDWDALDDEAGKELHEHILNIIVSKLIPDNEIHFVSYGPDRELIDKIKVILDGVV
jgi:hypothetical protein